MKEINPKAVDAFAMLLAMKKLQRRFASKEQYTAEYARQLNSIPESLKTEVYAQTIFYEAHKSLVMDLWHDRWEHRESSVAQTLKIRKARSEWFRSVWFSSGMYNLAYRMAVELRMAPEAAGYWLKVIIRWLEIARTLWDGSFGDPFDLADELDVRMRRGQQVLNRYRQDIEKMDEAYRERARATLKGMEENHNNECGLAILFPTTLLGRRGGAKASNEAAMRGWLIRALDNLMPDIKEERFAIIVALLQSAHITGLTPQLVRATLKGGRT